ncbi:molybdopterin molybdotransferase MoeA [Streptomyces sp. TP-A0874]|uniref:molybdopterin molybdotransferase MoeA n=1 Tax=Streptomyces sp. TP-A0874 TaxID=549819 RepID=UPI000852D571|nr:molybdopterin molybdotransferase MoeA [Streptomyces sp. TP-A0874]
MTGSAMDRATEEALAVANEDGDRGTSGPGTSGPAGRSRGEDDPAAAGARSGLPWPRAREIAGRAATGPAAPVRRELDETLGEVLAEPLVALTDLPAFDTSAMDGWAIAGPGPWRLVDGPGLLAGRSGAGELADGQAVAIATGARIPAGATAVLRTEHGELRRSDFPAGEDPDGPVDVRPADSRGSPGEPTGAAYLHVLGDRARTPGQDIRPRGQECHRGDRLLPAGSPVTPAVLGLAAAAGYDRLAVFPRPRVEILVLGDELLHRGLPREGLIRDALGPLLAPWLRALGAEVVSSRHLGDDAEVLRTAVTTSTADLLVTTGGTAAGPVDHVHPILRAAGAELLVDGVAVRPGHPMLLARLAPGRHLVGLPGNPLAAVSALFSLAEPLLRVLSGRGPALRSTARLTQGVPGHPENTRLVPVALRGGRAAPLPFDGPAMLRGVAAADGLAVVPPGGVAAGTEAEMLKLPWFEGETSQ